MANDAIICHKLGMGRVGNFMGRVGSGFFHSGRVGSGQHIFSGLVGSGFLSFKSKSGQNLRFKNAIFEVKTRFFLYTGGYREKNLVFYLKKWHFWTSNFDPREDCSKNCP